mgnify:CR=1 FL=1|tara:strand:- start:3035 stop:3622 length:588 start_codon:yes stop_codon:yes gene_type:complete
MNKEFEFYFDFISPYTYLAYKKISMMNKNNIEVIYKPILLGGLHKILNITAPAFTKSKSKYLKYDCEMIAKKSKIDFIFNEKFPINSLHLMRGFLIIEDIKKKEFLKNFFDAYWGQNIDISNEKEVAKILEKLEIDVNFFFKKIKDEKVKDQLKELTHQAFTKDIFGAPTFRINNKIFWGQDRLEYALDEYYKVK